MAYIKKITMRGFKSFAKQTEIIFDKDLSVIVGPNGAGKSNVCDALCFVLGRLSIKSMRAAKAANLIYHGGKGGKPASEAKVTLVLDNSDKLFSLPGDVEIQRIVRKSGTSIYKINNKTKTRQEVLELLSQAGIDPAGFNIILQAGIARFVEMHPEERRKIIEEIAGISVYEARKQKSIRELEKTDEKLRQVSTILDERRAYLRNLDKERSEALRYQKYEETVKRCKATLLYKKLEEKEKELKGLNEEIGKRGKVIESRGSSLTAAKDSIRKLRDEIQGINQHIEESGGVKQENLNSEIIKLKQDVATSGVRKENYEAKIEENEKRKEHLKKSIAEYEFQIAELKKLKPKAAKSRENLETKKKELEDAEKKRAEFYKTKQKHAEIKSRLSNKKDVLQRIKNQSEFTLKQIESASSKLSELTEDLDEVNDKLAEFKRQHEKNKGSIEKNQNRIIELEKDISKKESEIAGQQKIKLDISKIDICPLCKTKLTKEHIGHVVNNANRISKEAENSITGFREELEKIKTLNLKVKEDSEKQLGLIREKEYDLTHISDILVQKGHLCRLEEDKEKLKKEVKELEKQESGFEAQVNRFGYIEKEYDDLRLKVQELSEISEDDRDAQLSLKTLELDKTKNIIRGIGREQEANTISWGELSAEIEEKQGILEKKEEQDKILKEKFKEFLAKKTKLQEEASSLEKGQIRAEGEKRHEEDFLNSIKVEVARVKAEHETTSEEFNPFRGVELIKGSREKLREQLNKSQEALIRIGNVNMKALKAYENVKVEYDKIEKMAGRLSQEKQEIINVMDEVDRSKKKAFMKVFTPVNESFYSNFTKLSNKGRAYLEIENKENPFEGGLSIVVKIAKGKYLDVSSLSGGEKTLVALSLIFAIQEYQPHHFYIFDEIDAALDKRNSEKLISLINSSLRKAQYIVITHNDYLISGGKTLYGVSMQDGVSKILSLQV